MDRNYVFRGTTENVLGFLLLICRGTTGFKLDCCLRFLHELSWLG